MFKSLGLYSISSFLPALGALILMPLATRLLDKDDYGLVSTINIFLALSLILVSFCLDRALLRLYFDYDSKDRKVFTGTLLLASISFYAIFLLLFFLINYIFLDLSIYFEYEFTLFFIFSTLLSLLIKGLLVSYLRAAEKPFLFLSLTFATVFLQTSLGIAFFLYQPSIDYYFIGIGAGSLCVIFICLICFRQYLSLSFNYSMFKEALSFSWPIIPTLIIAWLLNWSTSLFLINFHSLTLAAEYNVAYRISSLFLLMSSAFASAFYPIFFRLSKEEKVNNKSLKALLNFGISLNIFMGSVLVLFGENLVKILSGDSYENVVIFQIILAISFTVNGISSVINGAIIQFRKKTKVDFYITVVVFFISIFLSIILIPAYGVIGAVSVVFATSLILLVSSTIYTFQRLKFNLVNFKNSSFLFIFCIGTSIALQEIINYEFFTSASIKLLLMMLALGVFMTVNKKTIKVLLDI